MSAWKEIMNGFDFTPLWNMLLSAIPALLCITLHELSHGYVAYLLGDDTAKRAGRLTLNPISHLDWMGFLMLIVAHVGWAKPVPVNMRNFEEPKRGMAITALAGPVANLLIAAVFAFLYGFVLPIAVNRGGLILEYGLPLLNMTAYLSLGLALFNLLPIPPLDGSKVLFAILPDEAYGVLMRYERYGMILLIILAVSGVTGNFLGTAIDRVFSLFMPLARAGSLWSYSLFYA